MAKTAKDGRIYRSVEEKKEIAAYVLEHGPKVAGEKFGVHASLAGRWSRGLGLGGKRTGRPKKAEAVAKEFGHTKGNGAASSDHLELARVNRTALMFMERWKGKQRDHIRRGGADNPYDLEAEHAYRVLRGEA